MGDEARIRAVNLASKVAKARTTPGVFYQGILIMDKSDSKRNLIDQIGITTRWSCQFLNPNNNLFYTKDDNKLKLVNQQTLKLGRRRTRWIENLILQSQIRTKIRYLLEQPSTENIS